MRVSSMLVLALHTCGALRMPAATVDRRAALLGSAGFLATRLRLPAWADDPSAAINVQRFGFAGTVTPLSLIGGYARYDDQLSTPKGAKRPSVAMHFEFPSQLEQLQKALGGVQFVDGNSGLKVYVVRAPLPGVGLAETPKAWFGASIFSPEGAIAKYGTNIEEYKVTSAKVVEPPEGGAPTRRRVQIKYSVVTPANQRVVDRRAVVDAYEVDGLAFMLVATASGSKWEGGEKERCERIAQSFYIGE